MMFYGGGGVSAVGNPENVAKDPKTLTSVNELRNLIFCDYGEFKKDLQQMQLHEGWGDFKSITYKDCIIPIEQEEKLRKIDIQSLGLISIKSEDIPDFQPVPISNQPKAEEIGTQNEFNQILESAHVLDDGLEFTNAFAKDSNMDGEDTKMEEETISHDAFQFELLSTQMSEPSSTQIVANDYPLSPLFGSSFHPDERFVDSIDGAAVSIEDFSQSLKTQAPAIEIEQVNEISSYVTVSQENENLVSDSIFQEVQTQEPGMSQENQNSDDGSFVDYMGIEDEFATQPTPKQDQGPNEIDEINAALLKEAQKLINHSYAATRTQDLNDDLVTQAPNPQDISKVESEPMNTPAQNVATPTQNETNTAMPENLPSDFGQSRENSVSQKVIDPSESITSESFLQTDESSSLVPADSLGNELHTQPLDAADNPDKDSNSDSLSFTSETSCSYIFKDINVTPRGFEQAGVGDELEDLPVFSLVGEGASCLADSLTIDSNVARPIGANSDSVESTKERDTISVIMDSDSKSRQVSKPLSPKNHEIELNRRAEKINLDDENLHLNSQEPPTNSNDGNGGALSQKGPGDNYSLGAQIEAPKTDFDTVNPILFLGATIGAVPGQITGEKLTQEAMKLSPPRTHISVVSSGFSAVQTPKNRFRGVMSADSPLWTQLEHSQPSNPATPTIGSLKFSPNPQTPVISQMLIARSQPTATYISDKPEQVQIERIPSSDNNSKSSRLEQDTIQILEPQFESHTADSQLSFMPIGISPIKNPAIASDRVLQQSSPILLRNTVKRHIFSASLLKALNDNVPSSPAPKDLDTNESAINISDAKLEIGMQEYGNIC